MCTFCKKLIFIATAILVWLLTPINNYLVNKHSKKIIKHQPIFIIGAPRTGSTILYQTLTNQSDVLYFDNVVCRFNKILFLGFWLSNKIFGDRAHNSFQSKYGDTSLEGAHAPSECGGFWYRWLPIDRHFVDDADLEKINTKQIQKEITAVSNYFNKPLVFKNLNAGQRLRLLHRIFPNAKFVFVRRDPFYTAQSILLSKRKLGLADNQLWSIMPRNVKVLKELDWPDQIAKQIYFLEEQILLDSKLFPSENFFEIEYQNLNNETVNDLRLKLNLQPRVLFNETEFNMSQRTTISEADKHKLVEAIEGLGM